ncbi:kielin/chordin-like protein [Crassostrea angulata]|uniref:kielin/chordin-like protein n=1 Tax=Magallana angulata TaxID=2784310 RepID=UPI0022B10A67|nr:kielin/chordin-like protein [Crassostrea angulata]
MFVFFIICTLTFSASVNGIRQYQTSIPDYLKCPYGKYYKHIGKPPTCNPFGQSCPPGFYCGAGPADQPGFCCKSDNPCKLGEPYSRNGNAPHCLGKSGISCPRGYTCIGTKTSSSVCCKGCTYRGESYFPKAIFYNTEGERCTCGENGKVRCTKPVTCKGANGKVYKVGESFKVDCNTCSCRSDGRIVCTLIDCRKKCKYYGKVYTEGDRFPARDGCNTCTCKYDGSVSCTEIACGYGK